ncbi:hypothetical protein BJ170DRAFT_646590 [Xylariales sp. AK1849]|nr:hypothetical protein BJ170DRAFT_646590 [Xylariales sp. AK1849]
MAINSFGPPECIVTLQSNLKYTFTGTGHLLEALRAPGSGFNGPHNHHGTEGYRRLAQLGESLVRVAIIEESYARGLDRGMTNMAIQRMPEHLLTCGKSMQLDGCINQNPSQQGERPSPKMVTQCMQALLAAVYFDCEQDMRRFKEVLLGINLLSQVEHTTPLFGDSVMVMQS